MWTAHISFRATRARCPADNLAGQGPGVACTVRIAARPNPLIDTPMAGKKRASVTLSPEGSCPLFSARQLIAWTPCSGSKRTRNGRLGASAKGLPLAGSVPFEHEIGGAEGGIRTHDRRFTKPMLYP